MPAVQANIEISSEVLSAAVAQSLFKGELGERVAVELANLYAEVTTYNRTDAAKLLNVGRSTLHGYETDGLIKFDTDGRISLADLRAFRQSRSGTGPKQVNRKARKNGKRQVK